MRVIKYYNKGNQEMIDSKDMSIKLVSESNFKDKLYKNNQDLFIGFVHEEVIAEQWEQVQRNSGNRSPIAMVWRMNGRWGGRDSENELLLLVIWDMKKQGLVLTILRGLKRDCLSNKRFWCLFPSTTVPRKSNCPLVL